MKRTVYFVGVIVICLFIACAGSVMAFASNNLVENSGFEENLYYWDWKNAEMERVTDNPHSGEACAKVTLTEVAGRGRYAFNFQPGVNYKVSFWTRVEKGSDTAKILISHASDLYGLNVNVSGKETKTVGTEWTEITTTYCFNGDEDMGWAWISLNWGGGKTTPTHYIDDVTVEIADGSEDFAETSVKDGEIAVNTGLDKSAEGYIAKDAALSIISKNTYGETQGSGKISVQKNNGYVGQEVTLKPGKYYELSCRIRTDGAVVPFKYVVDFSDSSEIMLQKTVLDTAKEAGKNWTLITAGFTYPENKEENSALVYLSADGGKKNITYYLDDFSIAEKEKSNAADSAGSLQNGAAENKKTEKLTVNLKTYEVIYNDKFTDIINQPYLLQNDVMCSGVEFSKILGISFAEENGIITIGEGENCLQMRVGSKILIKNGTAYPLKAAPVKTAAGIDVPMEILAAYKGLDFTYDSETGVLQAIN